MNKKVFLVEDDSAIADIYKTLMEKSGFSIEVFSLGQEALRSLKKAEGKPNIILLDLILPDINGIEILREVKSNDATKDIKVFILTNQGEVKFEDSIKPDKVIIKANITPTQLVELVEKEFLN